MGVAMKVILHCSASRWGNAAEFAIWHSRDRGWRTIGYHYVVLNGQISPDHFNTFFDGTIESGRPIDENNLIDEFERGVHTKGHNRNSIGICLVGKSGTFTPNQFKGLHMILEMLKVQFGPLKIGQHSDYDKDKPYCAGLKKATMVELNKLYGGMS